MNKGKFITIYGINNVGKTTHAKRLVQHLKKLGKKAIYIKYPIYSQKPTGPRINKILRSRGNQKISEEELQLWFVLNRYQFQPRLEKMLEGGTTVIAEDYTGTGIAWGTAKGADKRELEIMNKYLVQEDAAFLMEGQRHLAAKEKRHLHEQDDELTRRCQRVFRELGKKYGWKVIKVDSNPDITADRLWTAVKKYLVTPS